MAPYTATLSPTYDSLSLSDKDRIKLRKPLVEKMRRDRINTCIDQLKSLLEREFQSQDPNAKLEKADILEMTVSFLKRQRLLGPAVLGQRDYNEGYSQCWRESVCGSSPSAAQILSACSSRAASLREPHSPPRSPQDLTTSSSSPSSSSPSSVLSISSPVISKQNSVSVIHHAAGRRSVWRPWQ